MSLLDALPIYKPFSYEWAYDAWRMQQRLHWLPEEVPLAEDVKDWRNNLEPKEKHLLTQIFRFFTQADVEVGNCYMQHYASVFKPTEVCMMLAAFCNMETIHVDAYSHLLDTVGMPEIEYQAFLKYEEMKNKYEYMQKFNMDSKENIAVTLAAFGAFTEGLQLFASFAILLNFPRFNKMKGMGQIVTWSVRDETLHTLSIIKLFKTFVHENREVWNKNLIKKLYDTCISIVHHEDAFIDLAFEMGDVEGLIARDVKLYIRYIADRRLTQLGLVPVFGVNSEAATSVGDHVENDDILLSKESFQEVLQENSLHIGTMALKHKGCNPLPWLDDILNGVEHTNFFENRATEYSRAATRGSWEEAFGDVILNDDDKVKQHAETV